MGQAEWQVPQGEVEARDQGRGRDSGLWGLKDEEHGRAFQQREQHVQRPREGAPCTKHEMVWQV